MKTLDRYDASALTEAQFEPGSRGRVLKNKLGIKLKREMDEAESVALKTATDKLLGMYDTGHRFTAEDIRRMHKIWLCDIYMWAGEYRQVNVSKNGFQFAASLHIPRLMAELEKGPLRKHTPCNFKSLDRIFQALAIVHVELVLIHPFREGNGRVARLLSTLMAFQAGLPMLNFRDITGKKRKNYFDAISSGLDRDYKPMEKLFEKIIATSEKISGGGL
ncbi:MAG: Fic family protein [Nitrospirae bacterium]|nr:Fic family protein [Nitrospirota bacterium]